MPLDVYDELESVAAIQRRYDRLPNAIQYTLKRLEKSEKFREVVRRLKSEDGWKDWHVLLAIFNAVVNWQMNSKGLSNDQDKLQEIGSKTVMRLWNEGERSTDPQIPVDNFTYEEMAFWLGFAIMDFLRRNGAEFRPRGYDHEKLRKLVKRKYNYFDLDAPHTPFFQEEQ